MKMILLAHLISKMHVERRDIRRDFWAILRIRASSCLALSERCLESEVCYAGRNKESGAELLISARKRV
jgi:hypothetical protein